ncbi:RNA-directed DNA polymerase, eukaryota [Tanacetum coccineum]
MQVQMTINNKLLRSSGDFSVASVRKIIDDKSLSDVDSKTRWIKYMPIKVIVHAWKVKTYSLPTRFNVSRRGIDIDSIMCAICDNGVETSDIVLLLLHGRPNGCKILVGGEVPYVRYESYEDCRSTLFSEAQLPELGIRAASQLNLTPEDMMEVARLSGTSLCSLG